MRRYIIIFLIFLPSITCFSQNSSNPHDKNYAVNYDNDAFFEAGIEELSKIVANSLSSQQINLEKIKSIELSIDVNSDGSISNVIFLDSIDSKIQIKLIETLSLLKFKPAKVNGVNITQNIIIIIPLNN